MKKTTYKLKLTLDRETIRPLTPDAMIRVAGGVSVLSTCCLTTENCTSFKTP